MDLGQIIAANLRKLRIERDISSSQLAKASGVSKAMLSEIERGNGNPTVNTLLKIANGLNVPYMRLMEEPEEEVELVRREEADVMTNGNGDYSLACYFTSTPGRNFEILYGHLKPHSVNDSLKHGDKAKEFVLVIKGRLELKSGGASYELDTGDALMFDASKNHSYINHGDEETEFMILNYYPE